MNKLSLICLALLLSACGGGSDTYKSAGMDPVAPAPPSPAAPPADAFYAQVEKISGNMPDNTDPDNIDKVVISQPDDTEPNKL